MSVWMIRSKTTKDTETGEPLYWSKEHGWTNQLFECETFTDEEHDDRNTVLPTDGEWEEVIGTTEFEEWKRENNILSDDDW